MVESISIVLVLSLGSFRDSLTLSSSSLSSSPCRTLLNARRDDATGSNVTPENRTSGESGSTVMSAPRSTTLPAPPVASDDLLVPARMVNEWVYCPRLAYLEWVEGQWAESADTADGTRRHRRVDQGKGKLPPAADLDPANADTGANADNGKDTTGTPDRMQTRSVELGSHSLGLVALRLLLDETMRVGAKSLRAVFRLPWSWTASAVALP